MYSPVHILEAGSNSRGVKRWGGGGGGGRGGGAEGGGGGGGGGGLFR